MTEALGVMIPIIAIVGVIIMIIYLRKFQHVERMAMLEKGVGAEMFNSMNSGTVSVSLRASLLLIGAGVGLLMGSLLDNLFALEEVAYFSMLFIFGGVGLGIAYFIEERKRKPGRNHIGS